MPSYLVGSRPLITKRRALFPFEEESASSLFGFHPRDFHPEAPDLLTGSAALEVLLRLQVFVFAAEQRMIQ